VISFFSQLSGPAFTCACVCLLHILSNPSNCLRPISTRPNSKRKIKTRRREYLGVACHFPYCDFSLSHVVDLIFVNSGGCEHLAEMETSDLWPPGHIISVPRTAAGACSCAMWHGGGISCARTGELRAMESGFFASSFSLFYLHLFLRIWSSRGRGDVGIVCVSVSACVCVVSVFSHCLLLFNLRYLCKGASFPLAWARLGLIPLLFLFFLASSFSSTTFHFSSSLFSPPLFHLV